MVDHASGAQAFYGVVAPLVVGLLLAVMVQGLVQPWLEYRRARARFLQLIMASRQAWTDDKNPGDVWHAFVAAAPLAAEAVLASRLSMLVRMRWTSTFLEVAERMKYLSRKRPGNPEEWELVRGALDQILRLLWVPRRWIFFAAGVARYGEVRR